MTQFQREVEEQPAVAERLLANARQQILPVAAAIAEAAPAGLVMAARGSSDHAAVYAKYLFETRNRLPVVLAAPSTFTLYRQPPRLERFAVLAISQAGTTPDVVEVLAEARRQGCVSVALTNHRDSALAAAATHVVELDAGEELSVPATKTYTASLMALALLSSALVPDLEFDAGLQQVPAGLRTALEGEEMIGPLVEELTGAERIAVLGRGHNLATALEVALKLMEAAYLVAEAGSVADFLHGPIAIVEPRFPVLLLRAGGPTDAEMADLASLLTERGARVFSMADGAGPPAGPTSVRLDTGLPEPLTPLSLAVAGQLLTAGLAKARGIDPDQPRGLRKVTSTR